MFRLGFFDYIVITSSIMMSFSSVGTLSIYWKSKHIPIFLL